MNQIIPISDLQTKTKKVVDGVKTSKDAVIITQRGRPAVLIVDYEEYLSMVHTLDEMSQPDWADRLAEAESDSRKGRGLSLTDMEKKINKTRTSK